MKNGKDGKDMRDLRDKKDKRPSSPSKIPGFIPLHGGYRKLYSYQKSVIVYDGTVRFCQRFLKRGDRTIDQMVQAARSGKQNIVEGSEAWAPPKKWK
jgi:hypothetical protein